MKRLKEKFKNFLIKKQVNEVLELGSMPIISAKITLSDGAKVETSGKVINLICSALTDDVAIPWHEKYMQRFEALTKECSEELDRLVREAKSKKEVSE